jgi:hypothetical protein
VAVEDLAVEAVILIPVPVPVAADNKRPTPA